MKLTKHAWILWGIALATVLTAALLIPFERSTVYRIALICTAVMFGVCAFSFYKAFITDQSCESKLLGWPIFKVGYTALIIQTVLAFILMALSTVYPVWIAILAEVLVFAATAFCLTARDAVREAVASLEASAAETTAAWKAIRARAAAIAAETGHPDIKKLAEEIRYADPTPTELDGEIAGMLETLSSYADAENIRRAFAMMEQRNALVKAGKK